MTSTTTAGPTRSTGPTFDPYDHTPELIRLRTAAQAGDWSAVQTYFAGLDPAAETARASSALAKLPGVEALLERAAADLPDAPLPRTLLAQRYAVIGWDILSGTPAEDLTQERFEEFASWLCRAERLLIAVCAEHPAYLPAWTVRLNTARGLELGQGEARRRYDRLAALDPHHWAAQAHLLRQLCPESGGTLDAVHAFARACAAAAPEGSVNAALVAVAHIEHWLATDDSEADTDEDGADEPEDTEDAQESEDAEDPAEPDHMSSAPVLDDLRRAARASVLHPAHRPGPDSLQAHNAFAFAFSVAGEPEDAAPHFAAIGEHATPFPWQCLNEPGEAFEAYRQYATEA